MTFKELYDDEATQRFVIEGHGKIRQLKKMAKVAVGEAKLDALIAVAAGVGSAVAFAAGAPAVGEALAAGSISVLSVSGHHLMQARAAGNEVELMKDKIQIAGANSHVRGNKYRVRSPSP